MRKRILTILLALCMVITLMPTAVFADGGGTGSEGEGSTAVTSITITDTADFKDSDGNISLPRSGDSPIDGKYYYYKLENELTINGELKITDDVVIDKNNKHLTLKNGISIGENANLTVKDKYSPELVLDGGTISGGTYECRVSNSGTINGGVFEKDVYNYSNARIKDGTFNAMVSVVTNETNVEISGGTFNGEVYSDSVAFTISGGTFTSTSKITLNNSATTITGGEFYCTIAAIDGGTLNIKNGVFRGNISVGEASLYIEGGTFYGSLPESFSGGYKVNFYLDENDTTPYMTKVVSGENATVEEPAELSFSSTNDGIKAKVVDWVTKSDDTDGNTVIEPFDFTTAVETKADKESKDLNLYALIELQIPYTIKVTNGSPQKDFTLELWNTDFVKFNDEADENTGEDDYTGGITVSGYKLTTNGSDKPSTLTFKGTLESLRSIFNENMGLFVVQNPNGAANTKLWTFSDDIWYVGTVSLENTGGELVPTALGDDDTDANTDDNNSNSIGSWIKNLGLYRAENDGTTTDIHYTPINNYYDSAYDNDRSDTDDKGTAPKQMTFTNTYSGTSELIPPSGPTHTTRYTVKFDSNGGSAVADKTLYSITGKVIEGVNAPTLEGKRFAGWTYEGAAVGEADTFYGLTKNFTTKTITLIAQWTEEEQPVPPTDEENGDKPNGSDGDKDIDRPSGNKENPENSASDDADTNEVPKTGDENSLPIWTAIILAAGSVLAGTRIYRKKDDENA